MADKGGIISESILTLAHRQKKVPNHIKNQKNLNKLFTEICVKFELSAQGSDLAPFVGNGTKVKTSSEIKPPLLSARNRNLPKPINFKSSNIDWYENK